MSGTPARCGIIGFPLAHTRSPELHRAFAAQCGVDQSYAVLAVREPDFEPALRAFFADGGRGLNVTVPYKARALEFADTAGEVAVRAGAANVLTRQPDGGIRADNVDGMGFIADLARRHFDPRSSSVYMLGAGGAAAGVTAALLEAGVASIALSNRNRDRALTLIERLGDRRVAEPGGGSGPFDLVVNATSASLANECPEFPASVIGSGTLAYDLAYAEEPTPFMRRAAAFGARSRDGWGMLVEQAAESFYLWHGVRPDTRGLHREPV